MSGSRYGDYGQDVRDRAFQFACRIVRFCDQSWKHGGVARVLAPQLARCGTSIGANLEEARETRYRIALTIETGIGSKAEAQLLLREAEQLAAILGAIVRNARRNLTRDAL